MAERYLIRDVRPDDAAALVAIFNPIIAAGVYTAFDEPLSVEAERAYIESFPSRGVFVLAETAADRCVVGFQSMEPFATYTKAFDHVGVLGTYVSLTRRRQGISRELFRHTFARAKQKGYEKIFTFVRADNPAALASYQSAGFSIVGVARKQAKIRGACIDEILIERFL